MAFYSGRNCAMGHATQTGSISASCRNPAQEMQRTGARERNCASKQVKPHTFDQACAQPTASSPFNPTRPAPVNAPVSERAVPTVGPDEWFVAAAVGCRLRPCVAHGVAERLASRDATSGKPPQVGSLFGPSLRSLPSVSQMNVNNALNMASVRDSEHLSEHASCRWPLLAAL